MKAYKLTAYIPQENPTETGVIVCPGGSYFWLDKATEGEKVAQWLSANGIAAFVLEYSHAGWAAYAYHIRIGGCSFPAGFNDLRKALDSVRARASEYGIRTDRIGCMGFSAGGHLVMHAAEQLAGTPQALAFVALMYPVVSMTHPCTHKRSRRGLLGEFPSKAMKDSLSLEHHVPVNCPPVFLMNCDDDPVVHYHNA
jgi:acetyl esterase/lipase